MEARHDAGLANSPLTSLLAELERQTHARHAWIGLEVRSEHGRHSFGPQHRAVLFGGNSRRAAT